MRNELHLIGVNMKENKFKIGDIVQLKSGGPMMTINEIDSWVPRSYNLKGPNPEYEKDEAKCFWFSNDKKCEDIFKLDSLKLIKDIEND
jgi:uncharacterized protein YodC (DUF2158 family)